MSKARNLTKILKTDNPFSSVDIALYLGYTPVSPTQLNTALDNLVAGAPGALNTLDELSAALGDDANFAATVTNALATKLVKSSNLSDLTDFAVARSNLGLGNVENKSSTTIRSEITSLNVTTALGFTPVNKAGDTELGAISIAGTSIPSQIGGNAYYTGGGSSPNSGRLFIGDGTGWKYRFSSRMSSTTTDLFTFQDNGTLFVSNSIQTPVIYDLNDTNYYLNANSFSQLGWLRLLADWGASPTHLEAFTIKGSYPSLTLRCTNGNKPVWLLHNDASASLIFYGIADGNPDSTAWSSKFALDTSGNTYSAASSRAPIFYDSNDTSCYTDPNAQSVLHTLHMRSWKGVMDRSWENYPCIHIWNDGTYGPQGEFRIHGGPGISGGDYSITVRADAGFVSGSDGRRKANVQTIQNALDKVLRLRGTSFNILSSDGLLDPYQKDKKFGLIAQEAISIIPEAVTYYSESDVPNENGWASAYSLDYASLTALLIEAIKEQQLQIEELRNK